MTSASVSVNAYLSPEFIDEVASLCANAKVENFQIVKDSRFGARVGVKTDAGEAWRHFDGCNPSLNKEWRDRINFEFGPEDCSVSVPVGAIKIVCDLGLAGADLIVNDNDISIVAKMPPL